MTTSHKSLVAGLVVALSLVCVASEAASKKRGFSGRSSSSKGLMHRNFSQRSSSHRARTNNNYHRTHVQRSSTQRRQPTISRNTAQKRTTIYKQQNKRQAPRVNTVFRKPTTTKPGVIAHRKPPVFKPHHKPHVKPTVLKPNHKPHFKPHHKPNYKPNFKPNFKPHFKPHHKPHFKPWLHRKTCFPKYNWCHYRPRHCHWWYDFCKPIRYCAPTECIRYVGTYVTCNAVVAGAVVEDARWHLGLKGVLLPGKGLGIESVEAGSPAEAAGLKAGMVVTVANGIQIADETSMPQAVEGSGGLLKLTVLDQADGQAADVTIQMQRLLAQNF